MRPHVVHAVMAGTAGVVAMDVATWWLYRREEPRAVAREHRARVSGRDTAHAAARRLARLAGSDAARHEPNAGGVAIHYALGIVPAMVYARQRRSRSWLRSGRGALYGLLLTVVNDEIAGRLLGIQGRQRDYPWQAHLRGVAGHVVLGMATEAALTRLEERP